VDLTHGYPVPAGPHETEEVIQRSRFRTVLAHAESAEDAHAFVDRIRARDPDATHHCWAFVAGPPGDTAHVGMSDDGEPSGTAGRPMLTALLHSGVGEVVGVCTRWYGGTKLGTGGLQRAYASGVKRTLEGLVTRERIARVRVDMTFHYPHVAAVQRALEDVDAETVAEHYEARVRYRVDVPEVRLERLAAALSDLTSGGVEIEAVDPG
jgi:uncharacterized YigZ family protein